MKIPTHIVIDTDDGWVWARDRHGNPCTEATAAEWADTLNGEREPDKRTFIVATVTPMLSHELLMAAKQDDTGEHERCPYDPGEEAPSVKE